MMAGGTDAHSGHPGHSLDPALTMTVGHDSLMEVDTKDNSGMEDGLTYQPQVRGLRNNKGDV